MSLLGRPTKTPPGMGNTGTGPGQPGPGVPLPTGPNPKPNTPPSNLEHAPDKTGPKIEGGGTDNLQFPKEGGTPAGNPDVPGEGVPLPKEKPRPTVTTKTDDPPPTDTSEQPAEPPTDAPSGDAGGGEPSPGQGGEQGESDNNPKDSCADCVAQPGFGESLIPIWGPAKSAIADFQRGHYIWGIVNTAMAVSDIFLVKAIATAAIKGIGKVGGAAIAATIRDTAEHAGEQVAKETGEHAAQSVGSHSPRPPYSDLSPGGGLAHHEGSHLGHTIAKHVGKSDAELASRLASSPKLSKASTFTSRAAAESGVSHVLDKNTAKIEAWLKHGQKPLVLEEPMTGVGRTLERGSAQAVDSTSVKVVLRKDSSSLGYHIVTAYPDI